MAKTKWKEIGKGIHVPKVGLDASLESKTRSLIPRGPEILGIGKNVIQSGIGPGDPPANFVGGTTSGSEWMLYWAYEILLGKEGEYWGFQQSFQGGRHRPGGSVVDFVLYMPRQTILVRLQTWRFHNALGALKIQSDIDQKIGLFGIGGEEILVDVYEQYFVNDKTGKAVLECAKDSIEGVEWPNPLSTGIAGDW